MKIVEGIYRLHPKTADLISSFNKVREFVLEHSRRALVELDRLQEYLVGFQS